MRETVTGAPPAAPTAHTQALRIILAMAPQPPGAAAGHLRLVEDLGYDSLRLMELVIALELHFGVRLTDGESPAIPYTDIDADADKLAAYLSAYVNEHA